MRFEGRLKSWNAERGFGFIEPTAGGQEIFVHVSAIPTDFRPPRIGQAFSFEVELNREGRKRAANVGVPVVPKPRRAVGSERAPRRHERPAEWNVLSATAIPAFLAIYGVVAVKWHVPAWVALVYLAMSLVCLLVYAFDKSAAVAGRWRSSERSLLLLGLLGGWPGGLIAQQLLRHKSSKASFRVAFWVTVIVNVGVFVGYHVVVRSTMGFKTP